MPTPPDQPPSPAPPANQSGSPAVPAPAATSRRGRIAAIDALRFLCMAQILGFHWLRACYKSGFFQNNAAPRGMRSIIWTYRNPQDGWNTLHWLLVDSGHGFSDLLNNLLGVAFGFGWQAVTVFLFLSGLSLALARPNGPGADGTWTRWLKRRLVSLLGPYYAVAIPMVLVLLLLPTLLVPVAAHLSPAISEKLRAFHAPNPVSVAFSHLLLFDPTHPSGVASFFVPAWWFMPSIVTAYLAFPACIRLVQRVGAGWFLVGAALIELVGQTLLTRQWVHPNAWYNALLLAPFPFAVGLVSGRALSGQDWSAFKPRPEWMFGVFCAGLGLTVVGNLANWFKTTYILSDFFLTFGLVMMGAVLAQLMAGSRAFSRLLKVDTYHIFLLHQPLALPIAVLSGKLFGVYAVPLGLIAYALVTLAVVSLFGRFYAWLTRLWGTHVARANTLPAVMPTL